MNELILDLPHHRTYLDALTCSVPRERALVRMQDVPVFAMYWWFFTHQDEWCPSFVVWRSYTLGSVTIRNVPVGGEWRGIYGS